MRWSIAFWLALAPTVSAATVSTSAWCYLRGPWNPVTGTYRAACADAWTEHFGGWQRDFYDSEVAEINVGSSVVAWTDSFATSVGGEGRAIFSARYLLTLIGGSNLLSDPYLGTFALYMPCLAVRGGSNNSAVMQGGYGSFAQWNEGNTCDHDTGIAPLILGVPTPVQLTLDARGRSGWAQFTGEFRFFGYGAESFAPVNDITYTFALDEALPIPEPGSLVLVMGAAVAWRVSAGGRKFRGY